MRSMLLAVCVLLSTGCRKDPADLAKPAPDPGAAAATASRAPSAAPIQTRDRLVQDFGVQQRAAREREAELDAMFDHDR